MKERTSEQLLEENQQLQDRLKTYEAQIGRIRPFPSGNLIDFSSFFKPPTIRFGIVSDTHMGSKYSRLNDLETAYDIFKKEKIHNVFHAGDISDGPYTMHPGMITEQNQSTYDDQIGFIIDKYPRRKGITTRFITGNHDNSWMKLAGVDIGLAIGKERDDMQYLGQIEEDCKLADGLVIRLRHPSDGGSYALSYKLQRYMDSLEGGTKPNVIIQGHYHTHYEMDYRNIFAIQAACFQHATLFLKSKGLQPSCSAIIVEANADRGINRFKTEKFKFY